eukprot:GHVU01206947.1.p2 GENE.GHVU01206947.1~~GHVU01206947.1.p2  ORF type:complete len:117 (-),score=32.86 GHVU01206947.1:34-384(-)
MDPCIHVCMMDICMYVCMYVRSRVCCCLRWQRIKEEMKRTEEGKEVLEELETGTLRRNKEKDLMRSVRKEAASLAEKADKEELLRLRGDADAGTYVRVRVHIYIIYNIYNIYDMSE